MSTTITIRDEGVRHAVESVLWRFAEGEVTGAEALDARLYGAAMAALGRRDGDYSYEENVEWIDESLSLMVEVREAIKRLRAVPLGAELALPIDPDEVASILSHVTLPLIEEYEAFWHRPRAERDQLTASRDGAMYLLDSIAGVEVTA